MATILFLAHRMPYPPNKGDKVRSYQVLKHWSEQHRLFLGCFVDDPEDARHIDFLRQRCAGSYFARLHRKIALMRASSAFLSNSALSPPYYHHRGLARWARGVMASEAPDTAYVFSSVMAQYIFDSAPRPSRVLVDFVDVNSEKWHEYADRKRFPASQIYRREASRLLHFDRRVAAQADASIFVSQPEAALFRKLAPEAKDKIFAIPNGIDPNYFSPANAGQHPQVRGRPLIVFTGRMDYWPNVDAVVWFSNAVFPKIFERFPDAAFLIVGAQPTGSVRALGARAGIVVTGAVSDVRPYVGHADVVVAPLRIGRGIQNKVLEGMAMARPVIVTPPALEGIEALPDKHVLMACDSDGFVRALDRIMNPIFAETLGAAARQRVVDLYDWSRSLAAYDRLLGG